MTSERAGRVSGWVRMVVLALVSVSWAVGCADDPAQVGLRLSDASRQGCGSSDQEHFDRPVALGARIDVMVHRGEVEVEVDEAVVEDPSVFQVEELGNPVGLRAVGVGETAVTVFDEGGLWVTGTLEVAAIASAAVESWDLSLYNLDVELEESHPEGRELVTGVGWALLPDGTLRLLATLRGSDGQALLGYGAADWEASEPALVSLAETDDRTNGLVVSHGDAGAGNVTLTVAGGGTFEVALLEAGGAVEMDVYWPDTGALGGGLELPVGATRVAVGVVFDDAGRFVRGDDGQPLTATIDDESVARLVSPPWAEPEGDVELDDLAVAILEDGRVAHVEGVAPGVTTLHLAAAGLAVEVQVTVPE